MSLQRKLAQRRKRRALRNRQSIVRGRSAQVPRVSVFRSLKHISAQVIDDSASHTCASFSSLQVSQSVGDKTAMARHVGSELAKKVLQQDITRVVFDRGRFAYHGRVKALAEGLREGGVQF